MNYCIYRLKNRADKNVLTFLKKMTSSANLDNTVLLLMSTDAGGRAANTFTGLHNIVYIYIYITQFIFKTVLKYLTEYLSSLNIRVYIRIQTDNRITQWLKPTFTPPPLERVERSQPYMGLRFPEWFRDTYSHQMRNLNDSLASLSTSYDVYETLLHALDLSTLKGYVILLRNGHVMVTWWARDGHVVVT